MAPKGDWNTTLDTETKWIKMDVKNAIFVLRREINNLQNAESEYQQDLPAATAYQKWNEVISCRNQLRMAHRRVSCFLDIYRPRIMFWCDQKEKWVYHDPSDAGRRCIAQYVPQFAGNNNIDYSPDGMATIQELWQGRNRPYQTPGDRFPNFHPGTSTKAPPQTPAATASAAAPPPPAETAASSSSAGAAPPVAKADAASSDASAGGQRPANPNIPIEKSSRKPLQKTIRL